MGRRTALQIFCWALIFWGASVVPVAAETGRVVLLFDERPGLPGMSGLEANQAMDFVC
jgi:hypothetical protein